MAAALRVIALLFVVATPVVTSFAGPIHDAIASNQWANTIVYGIYGLLALVTAPPKFGAKAKPGVEL